MTPDAIIRAAALLASLRKTPIFRLERLPPAVRPETEEEAYQLNDALQARLTAAGYGPVCGYKLGCTTPLMQQRIGVDHPVAACIRASNVFHGSYELHHEAHRGMGCETEIAVRLGKDLPLSGTRWDQDSLLPYVDTVMGSIELVEQRYVIQEETRAAHIPTVIADDFWQWGAVLGAPVAGWQGLDLTANKAVATLDGVSQGEGFGAAALGHPLAAVAWLANHLAARGRTLTAGMIVQTGSLIAPIRPQPGQTVVADHGPLGRVTFRSLA